MIPKVSAFGGEESINWEVRQGKERGTIWCLVVITLHPPGRAPSPPAWRREGRCLGWGLAKREEKAYGSGDPHLYPCQGTPPRSLAPGRAQGAGTVCCSIPSGFGSTSVDLFSPIGVTCRLRGLRGFIFWRAPCT